MDNIIVSVADLSALVDDLKARHMDYVRIELCEADPFPDPEFNLPPCLRPSAIKLSDPSFIVEFDDIDEAEIDKDLFSSCFHTNIDD